MAREAALQVLFAVDTADEIRAESVRAAFEAIALEFSLPTRARERALALAEGVALNLKQIDECIASACQRWKLYRLATVDRNVLRVAAYELLYDLDVPVEVVIDEAVEVARRFAGGESPAFVNGVLDLIEKSRPPSGGGT